MKRNDYLFGRSHQILKQTYIGLSVVMCSVVLSGLALFVSVPVAHGYAMIPDGSFEIQDQTWECDLNCINPVTDYFVASSLAVEGLYYAYIFHQAGIYQTISVPSDVTTLTLWYDNQPDGEETGSFTVAWLDPDSQEIYSQQTFDAQSDIWIQGDMAIPEAVRGQTAIIYVSNVTGFNRIDLLEYATDGDAEEEIDESAYATIKLKVVKDNGTGRPVNKVRVTVRRGTTKLQLRNLKNNTTVKKLTTNKKGKAPRFLVYEDITEDEELKLCVKKKQKKACANISPTIGKINTIIFGF